MNALTLNPTDLDYLAEQVARRMTRESTRLLDRRELAERLGISLKTLQRKLHAKELPAGVRVGGVRRWDWQEVLGLLPRAEKPRRRKRA